MRARNVKPGFFLNEELAEVPFEARLLFIGLWSYADREGRFEWRPKRIKAEIFPYDNIEITDFLRYLTDKNFVSQYQVDGCLYGVVENFKKHQRPHPTERPSTIPPPDNGESTLDNGEGTLDNGEGTLENGEGTLDNGESTITEIATIINELENNGESTLNNGESTLDNALIHRFTDSLIHRFTDSPKEENTLSAPKFFGAFENVKLSEDQYLKLVEKFGEKDAATWIEKLSSYIASKGKRYKSHYATILVWSQKDPPKNALVQKYGERAAKTINNLKEWLEENEDEEQKEIQRVNELIEPHV